MDMNQLLDLASNFSHNPAEQMDFMCDYIENNPIIYNYIKLKNEHIRKAYKINTLRSLSRSNTETIRSKYNLAFDNDFMDKMQSAVWIELYSEPNKAYYAVVEINRGTYFRARIYRPGCKESNGYQIAIGIPKKFGTTNDEYCNKKLAYSSKLFKCKADIGISEHSIVAIACGMYDNMNLNDIAISTVNHKNRDTYDNRPVNIEVLTDYQNNIHKSVSNELLSYGLFYSMDFEHCLKYKSLNADQKNNYLKACSHIKKSDNFDNINNSLLDNINTVNI